MTAVDTSVVVPALVGWHEHHDACAAAATGARIPGHVLAESYSVLTRLPSPHRLDAAVARTLLAGWFDQGGVLAASARLQRSLVHACGDAGIEGGAVYDGLVGLTARDHGEILLTRDRRAVRTYERLGIEYELLDP